MNKIESSDGLTLVEILVAIGILGMVSIILLTIFSGAFSSILVMGRKTNAVAQAQSIIDHAYESEISLDDYENYDNYMLDLKDYIELLDGSPVFGNFADPYDGNDIRYDLVKKTINEESLIQLSVLVFYEDGERSVVLTALIP